MNQYTIHNRYGLSPKQLFDLYMLNNDFYIEWDDYSSGLLTDNENMMDSNWMIKFVKYMKLDVLISYFPLLFIQTDNWTWDFGNSKSFTGQQNKRNIKSFDIIKKELYQYLINIVNTQSGSRQELDGIEYFQNFSTHELDPFVRSLTLDQDQQVRQYVLETINIFQNDTMMKYFMSITPHRLSDKFKFKNLQGPQSSWFESIVSVPAILGFDDLFHLIRPIVNNEKIIGPLELLAGMEINKQMIKDGLDKSDRESDSGENSYSFD